MNLATTDLRSWHCCAVLLCTSQGKVCFQQAERNVDAQGKSVSQVQVVTENDDRSSSASGQVDLYYP